MAKKKQTLSIESNNRVMVNDIFAHEDKVYLKSALLYQDIIKFGQLQQSPFRFTELARWLILNNHEFTTEYAGMHSIISYRISKRRDRIQGALDDLVKIGIVEKTGMVKAQKNDSIIPVYRLTSEGALIASIIRIGNLTTDASPLDAHKRELNDIYNNLISMLEGDSSLRIFTERLLRNIRDNDLFVELVAVFLLLLGTKVIQFPFPAALMYVVILAPTLPSVAEYMKEWKKAILELKETEQNVILLRYKQVLEKVHVMRKDFEELQYENRCDPRTVVLPYTCAKCGSLASIKLDIFKVLEYYFQWKVEVPITCSKCNSSCMASFGSSRALL